MIENLGYNFIHNNNNYTALLEFLGHYFWTTSKGMAAKRDDGEYHAA